MTLTMGKVIAALPSNSAALGRAVRTVNECNNCTCYSDFRYWDNFQEQNLVWLMREECIALSCHQNGQAAVGTTVASGGKPDELEPTLYLTGVPISFPTAELCSCMTKDFTSKAMLQQYTLCSAKQHRISLHRWY